MRKMAMLGPAMAWLMVLVTMCDAPAQTAKPKEGVAQKRASATKQSTASARPRAAQTAQSPSARKAQPAVKSASAAEEAAEPRSPGRLPRFFVQLDLDEDQRTEVYAIQQKYRDQLAELQRQLNELRGTRDSEIDAVLTAAQKEKLQQLRSAPRPSRSPDRVEVELPSGGNGEEISASQSNEG